MIAPFSCAENSGHFVNAADSSRSCESFVSVLSPRLEKCRIKHEDRSSAFTIRGSSKDETMLAGISNSRQAR